MTRVLVAGGGVAGPVLAMALQRVGIEATVFERDEEGAPEQGSWLTFQANGMDALAAIDAAGPLEALRLRRRDDRLRQRSGSRAGRDPAGRPTG